MVERVLRMHEVVGSIPTSSSPKLKFSSHSSAFVASDSALVFLLQFGVRSARRRPQGPPLR